MHYICNDNIIKCVEGPIRSAIAFATKLFHGIKQISQLLKQCF